MNAFVRKEIRLLAPAWGVALVAATMPMWVGQEFRSMALPCYGLAILFLGLTPIGQEVSWGTFSLLLSQPETRARFWRTKTRLLAVAALSAWAVCVGTWDHWDDRVYTFPKVVEISSLLTVLAFSGGLWTTLLLRDVTTAFFAAIVTPLLILTATDLWMQDNAKYFVEWMVGVPLGIYTVAGFFLARHLFLTAQDVPWRGAQVSLLRGGGRRFRWLAFGFRKKRGKWGALLVKELQFQEVPIVIAPLLLIVHLGALAVRCFAPAWAERVQVFNDVAVLWMVAPLVVGCAAVAEERRLNMLEGLLCLPVSRWRQFVVKFAVVMSLGWLLGAFAPWFLETVGGGRMGWHTALEQLSLWALGITGLSFFASTLSRGMLQAFTVAVLSPILLFFTVIEVPRFIGITGEVMMVSGRLWTDLAWLTMLPLGVWLAFGNFQTIQAGARLWRRNFIRLAATLAGVILLANAIYARAWEFLMPLEPRHSAARLSGTGRPMLAASILDGSVYALLPDGRLWMGRRRGSDGMLYGHFADGSNWVDVAAGDFRPMCAAAIKSDGTLWRMNGQLGPDRFGTGTDWKKVVASRPYFLALKGDGTIWGWGMNEHAMLAAVADPGSVGRPQVFTEPVRVVVGTNWRDVFALGSEDAVAVKEDGTSFQWGRDSSMMVRRVPSSPRALRAGMDGTNWSSMAEGQLLTLAVSKDGTLWGRGALPYTPLFHLIGGQPEDKVSPALWRAGTRTDWLAVALDGPDWVLLDKEGILSVAARLGSETKEPSKYRDWIAITAAGFDIWALAKDGTICCWDVFGGGSDREFAGFTLQPSRRPVASVNILEGK